MTKSAEPDGSVGLVQTRVVRIDLPPDGFALECGLHLPELEVAYETYGDLSPERDNAVFICHALSGDAHVAGYHDLEDPSTRGWWEQMVGPSKGIDTELYHVVCANVLGGCMGTTGPSSLDPLTGKPYGAAFPQITVGDIVKVHHALLKQLGIERLAAVIGGSFGGMQALEWAIRYPGMVEHCVLIATSARLTTQALAFDIVGRRAITADPDWQGGDYYSSNRRPVQGLAQARKIGHITYLSSEMMNIKFGRGRRQPVRTDAPQPDFQTSFEVESYLDYQAEKFVERFDANSYLHISRAMDNYDLEERYGSIREAVANLQAKTLVVALSKDWLFPPAQSVELAYALLRAGKRVSYCKLHAPHGHDAFLVDIKHLAEVIRAFLPWVGPRRLLSPGASPGARNRRERSAQHAIINDMVRPGARVLDLGCGNGELLGRLAGSRDAGGLGVEIDLAHVIDVIDRGQDVFQADIDEGLAMIPDGAYDYAVLNETMQVVRKPHYVLMEMLRVAREVIVGFPNFAAFSHRMHLLCTGRMPKSRSLPFEWYDTPNIHLFSLKDFVGICRGDNLRIEETVCLPRGSLGRLLVRIGFCNLGAERVIVRIRRAGNAGERQTPGDAGRCHPPNRR